MREYSKIKYKTNEILDKGLQKSKIKVRSKTKIFGRERKNMRKNDITKNQNSKKK